MIWNVLAVYDFKIYFCYIFLEWKGFVYDSQVFKDVIDRKKFIIFDKKYWLENAGYLNSNHFIVLYKKVKYYLKKLYLLCKN